MKKILAIACILCMTFATLTAFAAPVATTITTYDYSGTLANTDEMTIITTVTDVEEGDEITYYVANADEIVYIDQATVGTGETSVEFNFVATRGDLLTATAKNGSDQGYSLPAEFTFGAFGVNYMTAGNGTVTLVNADGQENADGEAMDLDSDGTADGYAFRGKLSGTTASEYGIKVTDAEENAVEYKAYGCDEEGNFVIVFEGLTATDFEGLTVTGYVK